MAAQPQCHPDNPVKHVGVLGFCPGPGPARSRDRIRSRSRSLLVVVLVLMLVIVLVLRRRARLFPAVRANSNHKLSPFISSSRVSKLPRSQTEDEDDEHEHEEDLRDDA